MQATHEFRALESTTPSVLVPAPQRALALSALFLAAAVTLVLVAAPPQLQPVGLPSDDAFFAIDGWSASNPMVETMNGNTYLTRLYRPVEGGETVTFTLATGQNVKTVYRAGADVPFLGSGYESQPVPPELQVVSNGRGVSLLRRGDEGWLQVYVYGERRGATGNGIVGWTLASFDTIVGQPNGYYLMRVLIPTSTADGATAQRLLQVADIIFPRVIDWYRR